LVCEGKWEREDEQRRGRRMCITKSSSKISKDASSLTLSKHKKNTLSSKNTSN
jgi:hypothetical protein